MGNGIANEVPVFILYTLWQLWFLCSDSNGMKQTKEGFMEKEIPSKTQ